MIYPPLDLLNMKLRNHQFSTPEQISKEPIEVTRSPILTKYELRLTRPNPPTKESIEKAKFRDKTFHWNSSVRSGNQRTTT